jgi:formate dehydrogenase subunit gamma
MTGTDMADAQAKGEGEGDSGAVATVRAVCAEMGNRPDALLEILHEVQARLGFVPAETLAPIAAALNLSRAEVHGVFTFYHDFRDAPAGRHIVKLCRAEACQSVGADALAAAAESVLGTPCGTTSADGQVTLEAVYCLGNCALGPAALVNGRLHGRLNNNKLTKIVKSLY